MMISTFISTIKGVTMKIFITGAEVRKVDNHTTYAVYYNNEFLSEFDDKSSALMFALDRQQIDQVLQSNLKTA